MKKGIALIGLCLWLQPVVGQPPAIESHHCPELLAIDGYGNEPAWRRADSICFDGRGCNSAASAVVKTLWNRDFLYLLFVVSDANLQASQTERDHRQLFLDDMAEFLIDTTFDRDSCWNESKIIYHINLLGAVKDDRGTARCFSDATWNGAATFAVRYNGTLNNPDDTDVGYSVEIAIP
jgi:hypothetical protein